MTSTKVCIIKFLRIDELRCIHLETCGSIFSPMNIFAPLFERSDKNILKKKRRYFILGIKNWSFVLEILLTYCSFDKEFQIRSWVPRIWKHFEFIRTICSNSLFKQWKAELFLKQNSTFLLVTGGFSDLIQWNN